MGFPQSLPWILLLLISCKTTSSDPSADDAEGELKMRVVEASLTDRGASGFGLQDGAESKKPTTCCACFWSGSDLCMDIDRDKIYETIENGEKLKREECEKTKEHPDRSYHECRWVKRDKKLKLPAGCYSRSRRACRNWLYYEKPQQACDQRLVLMDKQPLEEMWGGICDNVRLARQESTTTAHDSWGLSQIVMNAVNLEPNAETYHLRFFGKQTMKRLIDPLNNVWMVQDQLKENQVVTVLSNQNSGTGEGRTVNGRPVLNPETGETIRFESPALTTITSSKVEVSLLPCDMFPTCPIGDFGETMRCINPMGKNLQRCCCDLDDQKSAKAGTCKYFPAQDNEPPPLCEGQKDPGAAQQQRQNTSRGY